MSRTTKIVLGILAAGWFAVIFVGIGWVVGHRRQVGEAVRDAGYEVAQRAMPDDGMEAFLQAAPSRTQLTVTRVEDVPADSPLLKAAKSYDREQQAQQWHRWQREMRAGAYEKYGHRDPAWDKKAVELIESALLMTYEGPDAEREAAKARLVALAPEVEKTGCDDPTVLEVLSLAHQLSEDLDGAQRYAKQAVEAYQGSKYPATARWVGPERAASTTWLGGSGDEAEIAKYSELAIRWLKEAVHEKPKLEGHSRWMLFRIQQVLQGVLAPQRNEIRRMIAEDEKADPWLRAMATGFLHFELAWQSRGQGWARDVSAAGRQGFEENNVLAAKAFTEAWNLHPDYPEPAAQMIAIAATSPDATNITMRQWFDRAISAQFDYERAYGSYVNFLLPRWGGSLQEMWDFGVECLATNRFDTRVPCQIVDAAVSACNMVGFTDIWTTPGVYDALKTYYEKLLAAHNHWGDDIWSKSMWAGIAWKAGDLDQARKLLDELGDDLSGEALHAAVRTLPRDLRADVYSRTGAEAAQAEEIKALTAKGEYAKARELCNSILEAKPDEETGQFARSALVELRIMEGLAEGKWVPFMPPENLDGWRLGGGEWEVTSDGAVDGHPTQKYNHLFCNVDCTGDLEIRGTIEFPADSPAQRGGIAIRIIMAPLIYRVFFVLDRVNSEAVLLTTKKPVPVNAVNTVSVTRRGHRLSATVNGEQVFNGIPDAEPPYPPQPLMAGLYCDSPSGKGGHVIFRDIEIRRPD